jgi:hypothetical protein
VAAETILKVPIRVDGLYVESPGLNLARPMADFSRLPYNLEDEPVNTDPRTPNLAEVAFNARLGGDFTFPPGLHLHWALPDALTTGHHRDGDTTFPAVPNRWLVRRLDHTGKLEKSWVVESDFLHPCDKDGRPVVEVPSAGITVWPNNQPITFPTKRRQLSNQKQGAAFRYMGRSLLLSDWLHHAGSSAYLNQDTNSNYKLTALGYGEPAFAAYYPNCYSVFGFCDVDAALIAGNSYEYQVIGWFNEVNLDLLQSTDFSKLKTDAERYDALQQEYRWCVKDADKKKAFPVRTVCYASLTLTPNKVKPFQPQGTVDLAIGNTGGEALSALLAHDVAAPKQPSEEVRKELVEDQLEAMNVAATLQGVEVDYRAHFEQMRHERGFRGLAGGNRWAVVPKPAPSVSEAVTNNKPLSQPALPDAVAHALDALNTAQEAYDMARQEIRELRYQTFCDCHKFLAAYYSNGELEPYRKQSPDLAGFIQSQSLALLNTKIENAGKLVLTKDAAKAEGKVTATLALTGNILTPPQSDNTTFAVQVVLRLKALVDMMIVAKITDHFEIASQSAEHFWSPREPVVLLSGPVAVATPRHGEDGNLACTVMNVPDAPGTEAFINAVNTLKSAIPTDPCVLTQTHSPWHPIILEWSISVQPVAIGRTTNHDLNDELDYESTFLTQSFQLQQNDPDFLQNDSLSLLPRNTYEGRCVITPAASTQLDTSLSTFLIKATLDDCRDRSAAGDAGYVDRLIKWYQTKHNVTPPNTDAEKVLWLKQQKPFVDPANKDDNPRLLPVKDLFDWYGDKPVKGANATVKSWDDTQQAQDPIYSAIRSLNKLADRLVLSQALGGFNAALMTRQQVLQIPIEDPVEDDVLISLHLTSDVAKAVGKHHPTAPRAAKVFSPIRSGTMTLDGLRLIDTFGQQWNAPKDAKLVTSNSLSNPDETRIYLPPRFSTPARLNFRWLAAFSGQNGIEEVEMNSAPATTPICGWLIANNFDDSVMVYDNTGQALGSINSLAEWMPAPDSTDRLAASDIPNPHLRRLVRRLIIDAGTPANENNIRPLFMDSLLSTIDSAMEAIEPASFAQHEALALLMGRPIAVVRARVDLQFMGQPTHSETIEDATIAGGKAMQLRKSQYWKAFVDQSWPVFAYDWGHFYGCSLDQIINTQNCAFSETDRPLNYARTTRGFEKVVVPMRLGEHQLLNDGLVGFWKETADGELDNVFHAPQTLKDLKIDQAVTFREGLTTPCIRAYAEGVTDNLSVAAQDDPLALTMLMDPRGVVHATCGILPVNKLEIPSAYYADALKRMGVTFRVGPLVTDSEQLHAALPKEAGYAWSWITKPNGSTWEETTTIVDATEHTHFFKPPKIVEGWLKLTPKDED